MHHSGCFSARLSRVSGSLTVTCAHMLPLVALYFLPQFLIRERTHDTRRG